MCSNTRPMANSRRFTLMAFGTALVKQ
jgi:hypothetical protein